MKIAVVGDPFFPAEVLAEPLRDGDDELTLFDVVEGNGAPGRHGGIREYVGRAEDVAGILAGHQVLVVHAAPVTAEVLDAAPGLGLIGCARGGPVNVDLTAAARRGIPVVTAPGKNAHAVAELTVAFLIMLARRMRPALDDLVRAGRMGDSVIEGAAYMGAELRGRALGLIGYGHVGGLVAGLAVGAGMDVQAFDPHVPKAAMSADGVRAADLATLLSGSDFVSLHARATADNQRMIGEAQLAAMRPSAYLVNTARETLVDEEALHRALVAGTIAGAALDVLQPPPDGGRHPLLDRPEVIVTPHIGGATVETLRRGAAIIAEDVQRFRAGRPLVNVAVPAGAVVASQEGVA